MSYVENTETLIWPFQWSFGTVKTHKVYLVMNALHGQYILLLQCCFLKISHLNKKMSPPQMQSSAGHQRCPTASLPCSFLGARFRLSSHQRGNTSAVCAQQLEDHFVKCTGHFEQLSICSGVPVVSRVFCGEHKTSYSMSKYACIGSS